MRYLFGTLFFLFSISISGQILNVESLRKVTDTSGFTGSASVDFSLKRDKNEYHELTCNIHVEYTMNRHLVLWNNDLNLTSIEGIKSQNSGASHHRYNYRFRPRIAWEAFVQAQYCEVAKIDFRGLLGT